MIKKLIQYFHNKENIKEEKEEEKTHQFKNLMDKAITLHTKAQLEDLIKIVLKPVQADHIRDAYIKPYHGAKDSLLWPNSLQIINEIPALQNKTLSNCIFSKDPSFSITIRNKENYPTINLATDIVLPTCWSPSSIKNTIGSIGSGLPCGKFEQNMNHSIIYTYPLGISWVINGNHSIAQGIIRGQGTLIPEEVYDLTLLINAIKFDGINWRCLKSNNILGQPLYNEFGWVWELARLIIKKERDSVI